MSDAVEIGAEFSGANLGDLRLSKRLVKIAESVGRSPAAGLPQVMDDAAALEATYRFLGNESVTPEAILAPHVAQTVMRCAGSREVLAVHDRTTFQFGGEKWREEMGYMPNGTQGFFGHFTLAVMPGEKREVLGVVGMSGIFRAPPPKRRRKKKHVGPTETNDRRRWLDQALEVSETIGATAGVIHVMDREADIYWLMAGLKEEGARFVIRSHKDRAVEDDDADRMKDCLENALFVMEREVALTARHNHFTGAHACMHPDREARCARLGIYAREVTLQRSRQASEDLPESLTLNLVLVRELAPTDPASAVEWVLLTTEPIKTRRQVEKIVDAYRSRWVIEEYFKALKTGCAYEKRQLESRHALMNALAVFAPCAWRLMLLRTLSRHDDQRLASDVLGATQLQILEALPRTRLPMNSTVKDAMYAIAKLGGHLKRNGPPGWLTLGRGFDKLLSIELGWIAAKIYDQS